MFLLNNSFNLIGVFLDKVKINYIVDVLILITFIIVGITGIIKWPKLGLIDLFDFKLMMILHDFSGLFAIILAFFHVALNFNFMVCMTKKYVFKKK